MAVTTSSGVHAVPLAEFAVLGLLAMAKDLPRLVADQRAKAWPEVRQPFRELSGETLFLVGLGEIGREVARLGKALGMRTVGFRRTSARRRSGSTRSTAPSAWPSWPPGADAMVISLPMTEQTAGLVDRATIERAARELHLRQRRPRRRGRRAGPGGRPPRRRIAGAVLDVFATEPLPADSPSGPAQRARHPARPPLSARENERIIELFVDNLRRYLDGRPLRNRVEPGVYY